MSSTDSTPLDSAAALRVATQEILLIADTTFGGADSYFVRFRGRLKMDSIEAYRLISEKYRALGFTPLFRKDGDDHAVLAMKGTIDPPPSPVWVNALMFALTVVSVLYVGASYGYQGSTAPSTLPEWMSYWSAGIPFLASMLGILLAHELGHYFAARYHKVAVTLPYFIPLPTLFGTLGAFIMLKSPPTNRRVLLDIGIAGPLAGLVVAVPILIYGLATSPLQTIPTTFPPGQGVVFEGNSILYIAIKYLVFGKWLPTPSDFGGLPPLFYMLRYYLLGFPLPLGGLDVTLNALAWAGWGGLLVTGMNLIPAGQLDGGHALYVLIGKRARLAQPIILVVLIALGFFYTGWFIWAALIFFVVGRAHAEPLDQITEVDGARKFLAVLALVLFFLVITPIPLTGSAGI